MKETIYLLEIIAAIVATLTYKTYRDTPCRYFLWYLWFVVLVETMGWLPLMNYHQPDSWIIKAFSLVFSEEMIARNFWLMNLYDIVTYNFYLFFFYKLVRRRAYRKWILFFVLMLLAVMLYNLFYKTADFNKVFLVNYVITGSSIVFVASIMYFLTLLKNDAVDNLFASLPFWIILGTLVFQLGCTPIFIFSNELNFTGNTYNIILMVCNAILYGCMIIGFVTHALKPKIFT